MKKQKITAGILAGLLCLTLTIPAGAADFTGGTTETSTEGEEAVFQSGEAVPEPNDPEINAWEEQEQTELFSSGEQSDLSAEPEEMPGTEGLEYTYLSETDSYQVSKGVDQRFVIIPKIYNGKPVTEIGERVFAGFQKLQSVAFNGYITVREYAFEDCVKLRFVNTATMDGIHIKSHAFKNCPKLSDIGTIREGDAIKSTIIAKDAFDRDNKVLLSAFGVGYEMFRNVPIYVDDPECSFTDWQEGVEYWDIDNENIVRDFKEKQEVVHLTYEAKTKKIGRLAFYDCDELKKVEIPEGFEIIEKKAFAECDSLKEIRIPASIRKIGENAFAGSKNLSFYLQKGSYAEKYAKKHKIPYRYIPQTVELKKVTVNKNKVTVDTGKLSGDKYVCVLGNQLKNGVPVQTDGKGVKASARKESRTVFRNLEKRTYYVGVRSYKRENGRTIYGEWSEIKKIHITGDTPYRAKIKATAKSGKNLKVTTRFYDRDREWRVKGYDVVLARGTTINDDSSRAVPAPAKIVYQKKDINPKTLSVTFKNVKPGTYYLGIQSYSITNGKKIYGQWSKLKKLVWK